MVIGRWQFSVVIRNLIVSCLRPLCRALQVCRLHRQLLYARFDNPRDLWTLVHNVVHNLDSPADHFDLDRPPGIAECNPPDDVDDDKFEQLDEVVK